MFAVCKSGGTLVSSIQRLVHWTKFSSNFKHFPSAPSAKNTGPRRIRKCKKTKRRWCRGRKYLWQWGKTLHLIGYILVAKKKHTTAFTKKKEERIICISIHFDTTTHPFGCTICFERNKLSERFARTHPGLSILSAREALSLSRKLSWIWKTALQSKTKTNQPRECEVMLLLAG